MEQRDLLKDQIELFGKVLGKIMADFLGLKAEGKVVEGIEITNEEMKSKLDIDLDLLLTLPEKESIDYLQGRKLTSEHVEMLADYLIEIARSKSSNEKETTKSYLLKAASCYGIADKFSQQLSLERVAKKKHVETLLNN